MRKHVGHTRPHETVALLMHQHRGITRQRGRTARHIDDAPRTAFRRQRLDQRYRAFARRIDQHFVEGTEAAKLSPVISNRLATENSHCAARPLAFAAFSRARVTSSGTSLDSEHTSRRPCDRQGEICQAAKQVRNPFASPRCQQGHGTAHQHAVHARIHLGEFRRMKPEFQTEIRQLVAQHWRIGRMEQGVRCRGPSTADTR
jgi:hypothetical protein